MKNTKTQKQDGKAYYFTDGEVEVIMESLKNQEKKIREERFYRRIRSQEFYDIFLERLWKIMNKIDRPIRIIKNVKFPYL